MDIKFKKLFKTMVIFFVVFVMIFNSFAAISVSDGSAFVTKAEFSADLNNLSNRMSALENSIDAKIDSLVSSYLSRNGIWNGEKQTTSEVPTDAVGMKWISNGRGGWVWNSNIPNITQNEWGGQFSNNGLYYYATYYYRPEKTDTLSATIIPEVSKSGLCNLIIDFIDTSYFMVTFLNYNNRIAGDNWGSSFTQEYEIFSDNTLSYYDSFNFNMPVHASYQLNYKTKINCYFFVTKGKDVTIKITPTVTNSNMPIKRSQNTDTACKISNWSAYVY